MEYHSLPANIEKIYKQYLEAKNILRKMELLLDTYKNVIHYFGCIFLSEYMLSNEKKESINNQVNALARPSLGSWVGFIELYRKTYGGLDSLFIKEFSDSYKQLKKRKFEAYSISFRDESYKENDAINAILELRNMIAHGAMYPSDSEAKKIVERYGVMLEHILESFKDIFDNYRLVKMEDCYEDKDDADILCVKFSYIINGQDKEYFYQDYVYRNKPDCIDIDKINHLYLISSDNRLLELSEFLVDIVKENRKENYYLYDGLRNNYVVYLGTEYKEELNLFLESLRSKFISKGVSTSYKRRGFDLESFASYLNELTKTSINNHINSGKYHKKSYVERSCDSLFKDFLNSDATTMIVTADAGVGKTNFLCHSASKAIDDKAIVYFSNGGVITKINDTNNLFIKLQEECLNKEDFQSARDFLSFLNDVYNKNDCSIKFIWIIDAVNEAYDVESLLTEIGSLTALGMEYPWLKIVFSIRLVSYRIFMDKLCEGFGKKNPLFVEAGSDRYFHQVEQDERIKYEVEIKPFNSLQLIEAFNKYKDEFNMKDDEVNYHKLSSHMQDILSNPLNLNIYFSVISKGNNKEIKSQNDLFAELNNSLVNSKELTNVTSELIDLIVNQMYEDKNNELDYDIVEHYDDAVFKKWRNKIDNQHQLIILSPFERLEDVGIMCVRRDMESKLLVSFVYQKYFEYLLYKMITNKQYSLDELLDNFIESYKFKSLPEAFMAYEKVLEEKEDKLELLELLFTKIKDKAVPVENFKSVLVDFIYDMIRNKYSCKAIFKILSDAEVFDWTKEIVEKLFLEQEWDLTTYVIDEIKDYEYLFNNQELARLYYLKAMVYQNTNKISDSLDLLDKCIELNESNKDQYLIEKSKTLRKGGRAKEAIIILEDYLGNHDESCSYYDDALIQRGLCHILKTSMCDDNKLNEEYTLSTLNNYYLPAREISIKKGDVYTRIYNELGITTAWDKLAMYAKDSDEEKSKKYLKKAEELLLEVYADCKKHNYVNFMTDCLNAMAKNYNHQCRYSEALKAAQDGLTLWKHAKFYIGQLVMYSHMIEANIGLKADKTLIEDIIKEAQEAKKEVNEGAALKIYEDALSLAREYGVNV